MQVKFIPQGESFFVPRILVVGADDVVSLLRGWGYAPECAAGGRQALQVCAVICFDIVIGNLDLPDMPGLDFCNAFRALPRDGYGHFILLTPDGEVSAGLIGGADDSIAMPRAATELRARLLAATRRLSAQADMIAKGRVVGAKLAELQALYDSLDRDLLEARKLQQTLVRDHHASFPRGAASVLLRPSGHIGGDLASWFPISERKLALYSVDVSGHGVASAMMTARLAGLLSGASRDQNIALTGSDGGQGGAWPPEMVAYRLNRLMLQEIVVEQYFTMCYAEVDMVTGRVWLVQAGHPHPMILRKDGTVERIGAGGLPIGLIEGATWQRIEVQLNAGDRLFLVSDGVLECPDPTGAEYGEEALESFLHAAAGMEDKALLDALVGKLKDHRGGAGFPDDVSGLLFTYTG